MELLKEMKSRCKWVSKVKTKSEQKKKVGCKVTFNKCKGRLVVMGYTEKPGVDYEDTYSSVTKFVCKRILMAIVAKLDLELYQ